ncbi:MAG TPA: carbon-nitrogen hydrolase family protein [Bryobacteraceae bacterium]|nr:carbon-nitrogen hydrolase family protein [Bryobacteraceae bacterium]
MKLLLLVCACGVGAWAQTVNLRVAAVQFRSSFDIAGNTARIVEKLESLAADGVDVAVFPECAVTGYHTGPTMDATAEQLAAAETQIGQTCARRKIAAIVGSVYRAGERVYNVAVVFDENGRVVERYGKLYLAGEKWAVPGNHMALFSLRGVLSTVIICHDERYPELVRLPAIAGARVVYYISHESGMKQEEKLPGYRAQMMARAVENQMYAVAANAPGNVADNSGSHGQSRIIKDDGNVLREASIYGEDVLTETLPIRPGFLRRPLEGITAGWWREGLAQLQRDRHKRLD